MFVLLVLSMEHYLIEKAIIALVNGNNDVDYVFTGVNCRLKVDFKDKKRVFSTILMI